MNDRDEGSGNSARIVNLVFGAWLLISAFLWPHTSSQFTNTWLMGSLTIVITAASFRQPTLRYVSAAIGAWLIISAFALPTVSWGTTWSNFIVGVAIGFVSLFGGSSRGAALDSQT